MLVLINQLVLIELSLIIDIDSNLQVRLAVDAILMAEGAERKEQIAAWTDDKKEVSAYAMNLQQIHSGVIIPRSGWKCAKCDKTENLWLNLTDGMILCGRKIWDGSGGNDHAIEHYKETGYPLAVKLGTITADLEGAGNALLHLLVGAFSYKYYIVLSNVSDIVFLKWEIMEGWVFIGIGDVFFLFF